MKKWVSFFVLLVAVAFLSSSCSRSQETLGSSASNSKVYELKLAHNFLPTMVYSVIADEIAATITSKTNNQVKITTYPNSQLGQEATLLSGTETGTVDICLIGAGEPAKRVGALNIFEAPFLFKGIEHVEKVMESGIMKPYEKELSDKAGVTILGYVYSGTRNIVSDFVVDSTEDLKGKKFRVPPHAVPTYMAQYLMKSIPTAMVMSETYLGLQQGAIDLVECTLPWIDSMKFNEICKYYNLTAHQMPSYLYLISNKTLGKLPDNLSEIVKTCIAEGAIRTGRGIAAQETELIGKFKNAGMIMHTPAKPESFQEGLPIFLEKIVADGVYPKGLYESVAAIYSK
jgi:TRAP-type C4-dicarboxylate transport system substrate-binding protein